MELLQEPELICLRGATNNLQDKTVNKTSITEQQLFFFFFLTFRHLCWYDSCAFFFFFFFLKVGYECRTLTRIKYFIWYHRWRKKIWVFFFLRFCPWAALTWHAAAIWWYISSKIHFFFFSFSLEHRLAASALARPRVTSSHILNLLLRNVSQAFLFYTRAPLWFFDASPVAEIGGS